MVSQTCTFERRSAAPALPHLHTAAAAHSEGEIAHARSEHRQHAHGVGYCAALCTDLPSLLLLCCCHRCERPLPAMQSPAKRSHHSSSVSHACPALPRTVWSAHDPCSRLLFRASSRVCAHVRSTAFSHRNSATSVATGLALLVGAGIICASVAKRFGTTPPFLLCPHPLLPPPLRLHPCSVAPAAASTS